MNLRKCFLQMLLIVGFLFRNLIAQTVSTDTIIQSLNDADVYVRLSSVITLGKLKESRAVDALIMLLNDKSTLVREKVVFALGEIRDQRALDPLISAFSDSSLVVRRSIIEALGKLKNPQVVELLINSLNDKDIDIKINSIKALGEIEDTRAAKPLLKILHDNSFLVRSNVVRALSRIREPGSINKILELAFTDNPLNSLAEDAVISMNDPGSIDYIVKALQSKDSRIRERAAVILGKLSSTDLIKKVMLLLKSKNSAIRDGAIKALGEMNAQEAVDLLLLALKDPDYKIRESAAIALGKIGDTKAEATLIQLLRGNARLVVSFWSVGNRFCIRIIDSLFDSDIIKNVFINYKKLIKEGNNKSIIKLIVSIVQYGNAEMANIYLNCRQALLEKAGQLWGSKNGYFVSNKNYGNSGVSWGRN